MSNTSQANVCPKCGGTIPPEAPQGLCPRCLMMQASAGTEPGLAQAPKAAPPTRDELALCFPELEILEFIGQGGMGFVYKARQPKLERLVALKILPRSLATDPTFAERFTREARTLARLNHQNIVTIHDFGQAHGLFYLVMEFIDGVNLRQAMRAGRFTPQQALAVVPRICDALQFAHNEGVLHRDIKPENILLDSKGRVKIADFGIAKLVAIGPQGSPVSIAGSIGKDRPGPAPTLTETGKTLGTPHYMAPEQLEHPEDVDQRADIYSLGVVFYEMLTGELPLGRFAPPSDKSAVDARVDEVVLRALAKEREYRQKSAGEVKQQVETITSATGVPTMPTLASVVSQPHHQPDRFWKRSAVVVLGLVLIPVVLAVSGIILKRFWYARDQERLARQAAAEVANIATSEAAGKFVIGPTHVNFRLPHGPEVLDLAFELFVPANNLATVLFVRWDNDVPTIVPGFSAYYKVGPSGGVDVPYCTVSCEPIQQSRILAMTNDIEGRQTLARWGVPSPAAIAQTNVVQWNINLGLGFTSSQWLPMPAYHQVEMRLPQSVRTGYQRSVRLVDFQTPERDNIGQGKSGIELRILVQPLRSPPIKTVPHEIERTNYVAGGGLPGTMEQALQSLKTLPLEP